MPLTKRCKTCGAKKDLHKEFNIKEGRKRFDDCNECRNLQKAGLNPTPDIAKPKPTAHVQERDLDRERRKKQYNAAIKRQQSGLER